MTPLECMNSAGHQAVAARRLWTVAELFAALSARLCCPGLNGGIMASRGAGGSGLAPGEPMAI